MSPTRGKQTGAKTVFKYGTFAGVTFAAIIVAVIFVVLGRLNASPKEIINTPPMSTTPIPATSNLVFPSIELAMSKGSPDAPVTIIAYSDFLCTHCQQFSLTVEPQLDEAYVKTGKVRFIHKFMIVNSEESLLANEAAACAAEQGKFWEYYFLLMDQRALPWRDALPVVKLQALAEQIGLDMDQFNISLLSGKYEAFIKQNDDEGRALGITGVPVFFINGVEQAGAGSLEVLQEIIDPMLEEAGE
jgi:protein-disulfide isomerase